MNIDNKIKEEKQLLRKQIAQLKKTLSKEEKLAQSHSIFQQVEAMPLFQQAKTVLAYWSMPDEVETHRFVTRWYKEKTIILPLVVGDVLELRIYEGPESMVVGPVYDILEPQKGIPFEGSAIDFGIIPGVAFDKNGNRMGRGKGYYDKMLSTISVPKYAVGLSVQRVDSVPTHSFDIPMDGVIFPK